MAQNELVKIVDFERLMQFERRYTNGITGKADRAIPAWVFSHIDHINKQLVKESEKEYYPFNVQYVITGDLESGKEQQERKKRIQVERELLIMQGRYEEATKKGQTSA